MFGQFLCEWASPHPTRFCFLVQFCALCPKPWHLKHCWIEGVIRNSSTLKIMPVFWHINPPEISASTCFLSSHLSLIKGRSLPVLLDFIRSASAWIILLKSSNFLKSFPVMFIDVPTQVGTLTQVVTSVHLGRRTCIPIFLLTHLMPFSTRLGTQCFKMRLRMVNQILE